ncbi:hypothetical protein [Nocardiopsis trehalosi]|uniref:hypothetical protein n=1 Tax=Nocardiopsis trehalosi TaxID=109329 RepID=UPI0012FAA980|nr:hypothetical protein [Nocardiopsis trehalosi]
MDRIALVAVGAAVGLALARTGRRRLPPVPAPQPQTAAPAPAAFPARSRWERGAHVAQVAATAIAALALLFTAVSTFLSVQQSADSYDQWLLSQDAQAIENLGSSNISTRMAGLERLEVSIRQHSGTTGYVDRALEVHIAQRCQALHKEKYPAGSLEFAEVQDAYNAWLETEDDAPGARFADSCANSGLPDDWII